MSRALGKQLLEGLGFPINEGNQEIHPQPFKRLGLLRSLDVGQDLLGPGEPGVVGRLLGGNRSKS